MERYSHRSVHELLKVCSKQFSNFAALFGYEGNITITDAVALIRAYREIATEYTTVLHHLITTVGNVVYADVKYAYGTTTDLEFHLRINAAEGSTNFVCAVDVDECERRAKVSHLYHIESRGQIRIRSADIQFSFWDELRDPASDVRKKLRDGADRAELKFLRASRLAAQLILSNAGRRRRMKEYIDRRSADDDHDDFLISHDASIEISDMFAKPLFELGNGSRLADVYGIVATHHFLALFENLELGDDLMDNVFAADPIMMVAIVGVVQTNYTRTDFRDLTFT